MLNNLTNYQAEQAVIWGMIGNQQCLDLALAELTERHFADKVYRHIFLTVRQMYDEDKPINTASVWDRVKDAAKEYGLKSVVSDSYIGQTVLESDIAILKETAKNRQLYELSKQIIAGVDSHVAADEIAAAVEEAVAGLAGTVTAPIVTPKDQAERILGTVAAQMDEASRKKTSIYTGMSQLNRITGGFEAGDLVIISGPTGGGKTAFAMQLLRDISLTQKLPCLHINTEMSAKQIDIRWAALLSRDYTVNNATIRAGEISQEQFTSLVVDLDLMHKGELYSVTIPDLTVPSMLSTIRRFYRQKQIRALVVDYIGRVDTMNCTKDDWKQLLSAARKLKTIGQKFGLVTFMIAQNNAEGNLAMAGYMEHEADLHLHVRPLTEDEQKKYLEKMQTCWNYALVVKKGRSSPQGKIPMRFIGEKLTFIMDESEAKRYAMAHQQQEQDQNRTLFDGEGSTSFQNRRRNDYRRRAYAD